MEASGLLHIAFTAFIAAATLMVVLQPLARRLGMLDRPGGHKTHDGDIPVTGGAAIYAGLVLAILFGASVDGPGITLLAVAGLMVVVGALDDRFDISPTLRLFAHLFAATTLVLVTGFEVSDLGNLFGGGDLRLSFLGGVFTVVACVALVNAFNMLDGLDGLAGSAGLFACAGMAVLAQAAGAQTTALIACGLIGALLGFLVFNVPAGVNRRIRAFMGDAGSTLLGFVVAALGLTLVQTDQANVPPTYILWVAAIPIFELFATTFRRLLHGVSPLQADNHHFHHRLLRAGLSVRAIFLVYFVISGAMAFVAVWAYLDGVPDHWMFLGFVACFLGWLAFVHNVHRVAALLPQALQRPATEHSA